MSEDDMTVGIYKPMLQATYKAALDQKIHLMAIHSNAFGEGREICKATPRASFDPLKF